MSRNLRASIGLDEFSTRRLEELMNEFLPDAKLKLPVSEDVVPATWMSTRKTATYLQLR